MGNESLSNKAYQEIRQRIAMGVLTTKQPVSELSLSREIGIGRTPVREAIRRLQQEGWVEQVPRFGTIVRQPTRHELIELFEVRDAIESFAAGQAAERIRPADIDSLKSLCDRISKSIDVLTKSPSAPLSAERIADFLQGDMTFHTLIMGVAGNGRMIRIFAETRALGRIVNIRQQQPPDLAVLKTTFRDHTRIVEALEANNPAQSRKAMSTHIQNSRRIILEDFERHNSRSLEESVDIPEDIRQLLQLPATNPDRPRRVRSKS